ncbi:hypothetical protein [Pyxidicoccus trucidator]|uniref:hypothetical protein n=1 Tax=Pyxidicoccus trucidator TaxID=2709662 RepID=UPI0013D9DE63|nr:hypothetical protein [Pyxidicoccus trucidator]
MTFRISSKPLAQTAPLAAPTPPLPPPPPPRVQSNTADTFESPRSNSARPTTLRTEVLGDGQRNCLESAVSMARPGDSLVLLDDRRDGSGHALVLAPDGSVRDPNAPQIRYETLGQWLALHPDYQREATVPADRARAALAIPPGPERDAALRQLGLGAAANVAVADDPEWKNVTTGGGFFNASGVRMEEARGNEPVQVLRELSNEEDGALDSEANGTWYEVRRQDGSTAFVYEGRLADIQTSGSVAGLATPELGAAVTPLLPAEGGGFVQTFENGSIAIDAAGNKTVTGADGQPRPQVETGTVSSLAEANEHHVTQRGRYVDGVLTGDDYNSAPEWDGYDDCGPASVVISASLVGELPPPTAEGAHAAIENARDLAAGVDTSSSRTTDVIQLATSLRGLGATATVHAPASMDAIDAALAAGNPVIAGGHPFNSGAWGASTADYLEDGKKNFPHWVVVSGTTPEGNYLINDPLSPNGAIEVTREQLVAYLDEGMGMIEVSPSSLPAAS